MDNDSLRHDYKQDEPNCTHPSICNFPSIFIIDRPQLLQIFIGSIGSLYLFLAIAIVCDDFFVPSVERLCFYFKITVNVGGATFMAAATSSPEFFVNVFGTFVTESDIGIGTIVGSSVFNSIAISGFCGIFSGVHVGLDWWPMSRDIFWYVVSILFLTGFLRDHHIVLYEASILLITFIIYMICLVNDQRVQKWIRVEDGKEPACFKSLVLTPMDENNNRLYTDPHLDMTDDDFYKLTTFPREENFWDKVLWIVVWPLQLIFLWSVPDCRKEKFRSWFAITLVMSILWISIVTYFLSWMVTVIGFNLNVSDSVMGITVLAAGTSVPEAVSSIIVTRKGYGSMAICNGLASNSFNIFLCLGFPWFLKALLSENQEVKILSHSLVFDAISLLTTAGFLYICFVVTHFTIGRISGGLCLFVYFAYLTIAILMDVNLLGKMNKPTCENCEQKHMG